METNQETTPRDLASEYAQGLLSFDDYRNRRRQLIDRQTGAEGKLAVAGDSASQSASDLEEGRASLEGEGKYKSSPGGLLKIFLLVAGLALVAALIWWLVSSGSIKLFD